MEVLKFSEMRLKKDKVVFHLPIDKIRSNPYQPRKYFNRAALEELSESIKAYGVLQPITVRKMNGGYYELVAGERRLRASELAGLTTIPAILMQVSDSDSAVLAFIENIQRQNLSFLEEAEGYRNMMEDYGLTQEEAAGLKAHPKFSLSFDAMYRYALRYATGLGVDMFYSSNMKELKAADRILYGDAAVAAMSIVNRISFFIFAVGLGIGQGFQPVCSFNYGAKKFKRVKKGFFFM